MTTIRILKCQPIDEDMVRRYGDQINLTESKARRLEKKNKVRIIGEFKEENKKFKVTPRTKNIFKRVTTSPDSNLRIPLIMPYASNANIGFAYNDTMTRQIDDWVVFIDHDVWLANPLWHNICVAAIKKHGHEVGWFTCYTNRIGCRFQKAPRIDTKSDDLKYHRQYALSLYQQNKGRVKDFTNAKGGRFSGMFILTHKQAWADAGGFNEHIGFFGVDIKYFTALKNAGYKVMLMQDLYVYHGYFREFKKPYFTKEE